MRRIIILFDCAKLFTAFFMSFRRLKRMAIGQTMVILTENRYYLKAKKRLSLKKLKMKNIKKKTNTEHRTPRVFFY